MAGPTRRTGIDLSSERCILAEAVVDRARSGAQPVVSVRRFASIAAPLDEGRLASELKALIEGQGFARRAWITLWDVPSSHEYLRLPAAREPELRAQAKHQAAALLGLDDADLTVSTVIGNTRDAGDGRLKTEVAFFAAGTAAIAERLKPVEAAGFIIDGVTTPCGALWSLARLRRSSSLGGVHAYVALGMLQSAIAIFADGLMIYARDLDWGYAALSSGVRHHAHREALAMKLSAELRRSFLYVRQFWEEDVSLVLLCGDVPAPRSLIAPIIERLNVEVETLDTLEGLDPVTLPDGFAEAASTYRLAVAIAADPPPANLRPLGREPAPPRRVPVAAGLVAAGVVAAGLTSVLLIDRRAAEPQASPPPPPVVDASVPTQASTAATPAASVSAGPEAPPPQPQREAVPDSTSKAGGGAVSTPREPRPLDLAPAGGTPQVTTILHSSGRRVARLDDVIVGEGDDTPYGVVRRIEPDAVVVQRPGGRERRFPLREPGGSQ